jgi:hypothetical protein
MPAVTRLFAVAVLALASLAVIPSRADAQQDRPRLSVAAGGGIAVPFHADFDFNAPHWEASARGAIARYVVVEGFFEQWEHEQRQAFLNQVIQGPNGLLGRVDRVEQRTTYQMRTAGANVLATGGSQRVAFFGGGGIGMFAYERRFINTVTGCDAGAGPLCRETENTFSSNGFTVQGVAEVDAAVARRVQVFGRYMIVVPVADPGFGHATVGGGVRLLLW